MVHKARRAGLFTLLDYQRLAVLSTVLRKVRVLEGDIVEFGTYKGGSAGLIVQEIADTNKTLHIFDSFCGMPEVTEKDNYHKAGDFNDTELNSVRRGLDELNGRYQIYPGFFSDTVKMASDLKFSFAHIDVDLYESVKVCLEFCYPRMVSGGVIILDDYGAPTCEGAKLAADDFFADKPEKLFRLSDPAYGVIIAKGEVNLFDYVRKNAGAIASLPLIGHKVFR